MFVKRPFKRFLEEHIEYIEPCVRIPVVSTSFSGS